MLLYINYHLYFNIFYTTNFSLISISTTIHFYIKLQYKFNIYNFILIYIIINIICKLMIIHFFFSFFPFFLPFLFPLPLSFSPFVIQTTASLVLFVSLSPLPSSSSSAAGGRGGAASGAAGDGRPGGAGQLRRVTCEVGYRRGPVHGGAAPTGGGSDA
jgi:hypothetical protein